LIDKECKNNELNVYNPIFYNNSLFSLFLIKRFIIMINSMRFSLILIVSTVLSMSLFSMNHGDPSKKISAELLLTFRTVKDVPCMIYLTEQARHLPTIRGSKEAKGKFMFESLTTNAQKTQKKVTGILESAQIPFKSFYIVNAVSAVLDMELIDRIAALPEVAYITYDAPVKMEQPRFEELSDVRSGVPEWGLQIMKADSVWAMGINGEGAIVGGMDTGYDWTHPAIKQKYRGYISGEDADHNYNWHDAIHEISPLHNDTIVDPSNNPCGLDVDYPCDDGSHGTHTMGTIVGLDGDNIIGVAPGAKWIGVRNMERGWGKPSTYIEGFEWFLAPTDLNGENPDPSMAPHVINNSWSCPTIEGCDSTNWAFMETAMDNLRKAGTVVVVSASNNGNNCGRVNSPPAMFKNSFAVAATRTVDTIDGVFIDDIAGYSSWGPVIVDGSMRLKPDIAAPGSRVRSSIPGNSYRVSSGTSMAGPHVAGLVALLISANPNLAGQVDELEEIIQLTSDPKTRASECGNFSGDSIPNFVFGYGRINALEAVKTAQLYVSAQEVIENNSSLNFYPNPAKDYLTFDWNGDQASVNIKLMDQHGKMLAFETLRKKERLRIDNLNPGIYFIRTVLENQFVTKKLMVQ
jgi:subtilisin family serine protease